MTRKTHMNVVAVNGELALMSPNRGFAHNRIFLPLVLLLRTSFFGASLRWALAFLAPAHLVRLAKVPRSPVPG